MTAQVGNWTTVRCSTVGDGNLALGGKLDGFASFQETLSSGLIWYSIDDSNGNKESGEGTFDGVTTITRTTVYSTIVSAVYNESNPVAIQLSGDSVISCTMNATAFNDMTAELDSLRADVNSNVDSINTNASNIAINTADIATNRTDINTNTGNIQTNSDDISTLDGRVTINESDLHSREAAITAMEFIDTVSGGVSQSGNTSVLIEAGGGEFIDSYTDATDIQELDITWPSTTFDLLTNAGMPVTTGIGYTDIGINSSATFIAYPNGISRSQQKSAILLATVVYIDQVIENVSFNPIVSNQVGNSVSDLIDFVPVENKIQGMIVRPTEDVVVSDLAIWRDSGTAFKQGSNYTNTLTDQNVLNISAQGSDNVGISFYLTTYNNGDTALGAQTNQVPNDAFESGGGGTVTTVANGKTVIHYIYEVIGGNGLFFLQYAQQEYLDHSTAVTNLYADRAAQLVPEEFAQMLLLAQIVVDKGAVDWSTGTAEIFPLNSATSSGSTGGSASAAINVSYSDSFNIGNNVQSAIDSLASVKLTPDQNDAIDGANAPTSSNVLATMDDVTPKADLASPVFTGDPTAPTPTEGDNDTSLATTAFVTTAVDASIITSADTAVAMAIALG